jgi:hypothetical protein
MSDPTRIADRYHVHELLGRGGMACVYRVTDLANGRQLALKQLLPARQSHSGAVVALFEHEFRTLKQLSHPRVIAVYDYGVDVEGPYYTMELLDGGDLVARAPTPWRELCSLLFDVCSSLALLHSRRLLHRDINPRNIRCTQDGKAKLIDFGAMAPMGPGGAQIVGTPAFTPPETVHRLATDARADLFSLGATFYAALTGELPYPARSFAEVLAAWGLRPPPPSMRAPGVPPALDDLVLSLISLDPALRPQSAFDVMQRLAAIAGLDGQESLAVSRAYLSTPALVGRDDVLAELRGAIEETRQGHGRGVMLRGTAGVGRSRALDACAMAAMTQGALVLRATASGDPARFAVTSALIEDVLDALPREAVPEGFSELFDSERRPRDLADPALDAERLQRTVSRFLLAISRVQPLVLAIDDVERIDPASASVLAAVLEHAAHARVLVVMTAESAARGFALEVILRRSQERQLRALDRAETQQLLSSLFGDVAHLELLANETYAIAAGSPRTTLDVAQHLVDRGTIRYAAGSWTLPSRLSANDLPRDAESALQARIARMSEHARTIAQAQALAFYELFSLADYRTLLPAAAHGGVDEAVSELSSEGTLVYDGTRYRLANRLWRAALESGLDPDTAQQRHRALAGMYHAQNATFATVHHAFAAGLDELGLEALQSRYAEYEKGVDHKAVIEANVNKLAPSYRTAVRAALRLGRSARELNELRRWGVGASVATDEDCYHEHATPFFAQLERDSGLDLWRADAANRDAGDRLTKALTAAHARYLATPEAERVYTIEEAIRRLAEFVVCSIGVGARALDHALIATLAPMLEPFAPLSPMLGAIWNNAVASYEGNGACRFERARARWLSVLDGLRDANTEQITHLEAVRNAVTYAVGMSEATIGVSSASALAEVLDNDPYQRLSGLALRKIARLSQGDWKGADRLRREAEIVAVQLHSPPMFNTLMLVEFAAYAHARDLTNMQWVLDAMRPFAARYPTWDLHLREAQARFQRARGDAQAARLGFEDCLKRTALDAAGETPCWAVWVGAHAGLAETLFDLGQLEEARQCAAGALAVCDARGIENFAADLVRVLALCEAKLGDGARACERLEQLLRKQMELGISGLALGLSSEARARIAIWAEDGQAFEHYASLTAREYRYGANSPLGGRYERLLQEATRRGMHTTIQLSDFSTSTVLEDGTTALHDVHGAVLRAMAGAQHTEDRASRALRMLCETHGSSEGYLFLRSRGRSLAGLELGASYPRGTAPEGLHVLAHEHLLKNQIRTDMISDIATGDLEGEDQTHASSVRVDGATYNLMLLSCAVGGVVRVAGVAALAPGAATGEALSRLLLLTSLATQFVQAGDVGSGD